MPHSSSDRTKRKQVTRAGAAWRGLAGRYCRGETEGGETETVVMVSSGKVLIGFWGTNAK